MVPERKCTLASRKYFWIFLLGQHVYWKASNGSAKGLTCWNTPTGELRPLRKTWFGCVVSAGWTPWVLVFFFFIWIYCTGIRTDWNVKNWSYLSCILSQVLKVLFVPALPFYFNLLYTKYKRMKWDMPVFSCVFSSFHCNYLKHLQFMDNKKILKENMRTPCFDTVLI